MGDIVDIKVIEDEPSLEIDFFIENRENVKRFLKWEIS
jgi:hypothetical protein